VRSAIHIQTKTGRENRENLSAIACHLMVSANRFPQADFPLLIAVSQHQISSE
jgi:hypothetical protein